jgi:2-polyprenyl-3-methyl-5-hydroxy-6-metoxy-1,4-benzoquinol methylase
MVNSFTDKRVPDSHNLQSAPGSFDLHFSLESLDALDATEETHFWSVVKRRLICSLIHRYYHRNAPAIVDIGCGNGSLIQHLECEFPGSLLTGVDGYPEALAHCRKRSARATLILEDILHLERLPAGRLFDVVVIADVLEHLDEPERVLTGIQRLLSPDGIIVATVPASMHLWSDRDVFLGHRKRYTRAGFKQLFQDSGYVVVCSNYAFAYLFPPTFFFRKILSGFQGRSGRNMEKAELRQIPVINSLLTGIGIIECWLSAYIRMPFGTSTYCVARKRS